MSLAETSKLFIEGKSSNIPEEKPESEEMEEETQGKEI
jgi:hypothetical protein